MLLMLVIPNADADATSCVFSAAGATAASYRYLRLATAASAVFPCSTPARLFPCSPHRPDRRSTVRYDRMNLLPTTTNATNAATTATNNGAASTEGNSNGTASINGGTQTGGGGGSDRDGGGISDSGGGGGAGRPGWMRSVMDKNGQGLGLASSLAAAMETHAQFVFKGTMRGACAFLAILSLFLASCQIISFLQKEHEW